jgi:predicted nucleotide-binding protein
MADKTLCKDIFIVHGKDHTSLKELKTLLEEIGLNPIILHEQPSKGMTLIEKLEKYSDVGFAFIILTPDDIGAGKTDGMRIIAKTIGKDNPTQEEIAGFIHNNPEESTKMDSSLHILYKDRARQNVVLELGYFIGKLGRRNVCCLYKGNIELPSDMHGICYIYFENSIKEVCEVILKELKAVGYETDPNVVARYKLWASFQKKKS